MSFKESDKQRIRELIKKAQSDHGDQSAFAQLLTQVDILGPVCLQIPELLAPSHAAYRVGITGPPGAGKSTLISSLLHELANKKLKIGVLAVDPTSPISQGAILGDRIRYSEHALGGRVFVRSLGTRGSLGGLSASAYLMLRAFDACGFDLVLIETVGVGQVEVEVMNVADYVTVVLVPESGDSIQAMKAGIIEIADLFVVNKSDRPGAEALCKEIESAIRMGENPKNVRVLMASALNAQGIDAVSDEIIRAQANIDLRGHRVSAKRLREEAKALMRAALENEAARRVAHIDSPQKMSDLFAKSIT